MTLTEEQFGKIVYGGAKCMIATTALFEDILGEESPVIEFMEEFNILSIGIMEYWFLGKLGEEESKECVARMKELRLLIEAVTLATMGESIKNTNMEERTGLSIRAVKGLLEASMEQEAALDTTEKYQQYYDAVNWAPVLAAIDVENNVKSLSAELFQGTRVEIGEPV